MSETIVRSAAAPVPDVFMSTTDQKTVLGNGTLADPLRVSPAVTSLAAGLSVVLRPGGVAAGNVATTLPEAIALLGHVQGERVLQFDDSLQSPVVVPSGAWAMSGVAWDTFPGRVAQVSIAEGASLTGLRTIRGVRVTFTGTTPPITDLGAPGAPTGSLLLDEGAAITVSGAGPMIRVAHPAALRLGASAGVLTGASAVVNIPDANSLTVFAEGAFSTLRPQTVSGGEDAFLLLRIASSAAGDSNGALSTDQPAFDGTKLPSNATASRSYPTGVVPGGGAINLDTASLTVPFDPTAGAVLIFLPAASAVQGEDVTAKNVTTSVANDGILVAKSGETIDGAVNLHVSGARASATVRSNGVNQWYVVSRA